MLQNSKFYVNFTTVSWGGAKPLPNPTQLVSGHPLPRLPLAPSASRSSEPSAPRILRQLQTEILYPPLTAMGLNVLCSSIQVVRCSRISRYSRILGGCLNMLTIVNHSPLKRNRFVVSTSNPSDQCQLFDKL